MNKYLIAASAAALTLGLAGCDNSGNTTEADNMMMENMSANDMMANGMANDAGINSMAAAPMTAADFANTAAASGMFEIQSSQIALDKTRDPDVKAFAQMLIADHTKAGAELKTAVAKASPPITLNPTMTDQQTSNLRSLKEADPADFDQLYLSQQIPAHEMAISMVQGYAASGDVPALKDWATKTLPVLRTHLDKAKALRK